MIRNSAIFTYQTTPSQSPLVRITTTQAHNRINSFNTNKPTLRPKKTNRLISRRSSYNTNCYFRDRETERETTRKRRRERRKTRPFMATTGEKQVMVIGVDESEQSTYALEWTLDHFFAPFGSKSPFKLVIVHAKHMPSSIVGLSGPAAGEVLPIVDADLKRKAARVIDKAKEFCATKSVTDVTVEVVEGDARNVLCDAVDRYHASVLVVGSHGYGAIKRAVLGSVSDYCAHHAHCSVMIVKKPKTKH